MSEVSPYLVQMRPRGQPSAGCPQGTQYQMVLAQRYASYLSEEPATVVFQLAGSTVSPASNGQASGNFNSFRIAPPSNVCTISVMTPAADDNAMPTDASTPVGTVTYTLSDIQVLSDAAHGGNQFQGRALVDYGVPGCDRLEYVAQGIFPMTPCLNDSICLPDAVATDIPFPAGRGYGSFLNPDYRAFCNLDPALLDNQELKPLLESLGAGRSVYPGDAPVEDVGICFLSEPFPSLCPPGSTLSETGPCVVGPGSNPH